MDPEVADLQVRHLLFPVAAATRKLPPAGGLNFFRIWCLFHAQLLGNGVALPPQAFAAPSEDLVDQVRVEASRFGPAFHGNAGDKKHIALDITFGGSWRVFPLQEQVHADFFPMAANLET